MADLPPAELASILSTVVDDPEPARLLAQLYQAQGNYRSAVQCFERSIHPRSVKYMRAREKQIS
jgi:hypothetical protein